MNRVIFIFLLVLIPNLSFSKTMTSEDFVYSKIYECGPKQIEEYMFLSSLELSSYFLVHFDDQKNVVILNQHRQYQSFDPIELSQNPYRGGGKYWLEVTENDDNIYIMNMIRERFEKRSYYIEAKYIVQTLIFNESDLTFQKRTTHKNLNGEVIFSSDLTVGFCYPKKDYY